MSIVVPTLSLGLYVPNATFSRPSEVDGQAAGWTPQAVISGYSLYASGQVAGHARAQRYSMTTDTFGTIISSPCPPGKLVAVGTHKIFVAVLLRITGLVSSSRVQFELIRYGPTGTILQEEILLSQTAVCSTWTLVRATVTPTLTPVAHHCRYRIRFFRYAGSIVLDVAGFGIGIWDGTTGANGASYALPQYVAGIGSSPCWHQGDGQKPYVNTIGEERWIDSDRFVSPRAGVLAFDWLPQTAMDQLRYAWVMNHGRANEGGTSNPGGGRWPLLLLPGLPSWPEMLFCRFADERSPFTYNGDWYMDPAFYKGGFSVVEVL